MAERAETVARVIAAFGSQSALARALGARQSTVQHWAKTGQIPAWRHAEILRAAGERSIVLDLTGFAGAPPSPPPAGPGGGALTHGRADVADPEPVAGHELAALRTEVSQLREVVLRLVEEVTRLREAGAVPPPADGLPPAAAERAP